MIKLKRFAVVFISLAVCYFLQMVILTRVPNLIAVPNLLLIETLSIGFLFGKSAGLFVGVISGLLMDLLGSGVPGFYTLILALLGYGDGFLSEKMESELIFLLIVLLFINELLFHTYVFIFAFLIRKSFSFLPYLTDIFLPEILLTSVAFIILYGVLIFLTKRWDLKVNKGEVKVV